MLLLSLLSALRFWHISMLNPPLDVFKLTAKNSGIKGYKNMSKEISLSALNKSELLVSENNFDNEGLKKIREDFNKSR